MSPRTVDAYVKAVAGLAKHYQQSPDQLSDEQLKAAPGHLFHFPTVMGAVVLTYNVEGVGTGRPRDQLRPRACPCSTSAA